MLKKRKISPYLIIALSFVSVIIVGSLLFMLPWATPKDYNIRYVDALFTATSCVCVTGLVSTPPTAIAFTIFGKIVVALLIEIGGLGLITITMALFTMLGMRMGVSSQLLAKEALNQNFSKGITQLVKRAVFISLIVQSIGALVNFSVFREVYPVWEAAGISLFHAASAFNNAGFDIISTTGDSMMRFQGDVLLNLNTAALIIVGGIGFIVIYDVIAKRSWRGLSIHSKIVLKITAVLIIFGTLAFKIFEGANMTWLEAFFSSVSTRTAGFATLDMNTLSVASLLIMICLMFVGASPSSTGGGVKTTTIYTAGKSMQALILGKPATTHNRKIATVSIMKAFVLIVMSIGWILLVTLSISVIEKGNAALATPSGEHNAFTRILYETVSAFATCGLSMGITTSLHWGSKLILCLTMLIGRVGPVTFVSIWNKRGEVEQISGVGFLEEKMIIG